MHDYGPFANENLDLLHSFLGVWLYICDMWHVPRLFFRNRFSQGWLAWSFSSWKRVPNGPIYKIVTIGIWNIDHTENGFIHPHSRLNYVQPAHIYPRAAMTCYWTATLQHYCKSIAKWWYVCVCIIYCHLSFSLRELRIPPNGSRNSSDCVHEPLAGLVRDMLPMRSSRRENIASSII